jgi:hypothetical protein
VQQVIQRFAPGFKIGGRSVGGYGNWNQHGDG